MSLFGWEVVTARDSSAAGARIYDPILQSSRTVPRYRQVAQGTVRSVRAVPQPPPAVPAAASYKRQTASVVGTAAQVPPLKLREVQCERVVNTCFDDRPTCHLTLSHAYNRRVHSRGSMVRGNAVSSYTEAHCPQHPDRAYTSLPLGASHIKTIAELASPRPATAPRFARKAPAASASDSLVVSANSSRLPSARSRHPLNAHRPQTARAVMAEVSRRIEATQPQACVPRPVTARSSSSKARTLRSGAASIANASAAPGTATQPSPRRPVMYGAMTELDSEQAVRNEISTFERRHRTADSAQLTPSDFASLGSKE